MKLMLSTALGVCLTSVSGGALLYFQDKEATQDNHPVVTDQALPSTTLLSGPPGTLTYNLVGIGPSPKDVHMVSVPAGYAGSWVGRYPADETVPW